MQPAPHRFELQELQMPCGKRQSHREGASHGIYTRPQQQTAQRRPLRHLAMCQDHHHQSARSHFSSDGEVALPRSADRRADFSVTDGTEERAAGCILRHPAVAPASKSDEMAAEIAAAEVRSCNLAGRSDGQDGRCGVAGGQYGTGSESQSLIGDLPLPRARRRSEFGW